MIKKHISKVQHLFEIESFCNIINVFIASFDQFNASLLNKKVFWKIILLKKKSNQNWNYWYPALIIIALSKSKKNYIEM